jgi:hypothetical protein
MARFVVVKDFAALATEMQKLGIEIEGGENRLVKNIATHIHEPLVLGTAADTGEARSNWVVTTGRPNAAAIDPYAPGEHLGMGERQNARAAIDQGQGVIQSRRPGDTVFITNLADHIGQLNDGLVRFRPENRAAKAGFIEQAIDEGIEMGVRTTTIL